MDIVFAWDTFLVLLPAVPLTLQLALNAILCGGVLALLIALCRVSGKPWLDWPARTYVFAFRGTPLLVQLFLIYYGLGQFPAIRHSFLWPFLREPYWCAVLALTLNNGAYASEIIRGGLLSVPRGQIESAKACGMSPLLMFRRIVFPLAIRQALPAYGNETIAMVKATALASVITMMEITGVAAKLISETYRVVEVFVVAGALYLFINFVLTRLITLLEASLNPQARSDRQSTPSIKKVSA